MTLLRAMQAQRLKEGRAVDIAALLELKALVRYVPDSSDFDTWLDGGNPCNFAKVYSCQETDSFQIQA